MFIDVLFHNKQHKWLSINKMYVFCVHTQKNYSILSDKTDNPKKIFLIN